MVRVWSECQEPDAGRSPPWKRRPCQVPPPFVMAVKLSCTSTPANTENTRRNKPRLGRRRLVHSEATAQSPLRGWRPTASIDIASHLLQRIRTALATGRCWDRPCIHTLRSHHHGTTTTRPLCPLLRPLLSTPRPARRRGAHGSRRECSEEPTTTQSPLRRAPPPESNNGGDESDSPLTTWPRRGSSNGCLRSSSRNPQRGVSSPELLSPQGPQAAAAAGRTDAICRRVEARKGPPHSAAQRRRRHATLVVVLPEIARLLPQHRPRLQS